MRGYRVIIVCVRVSAAIIGKRLEPSTPNLVHMHSMAGPRNALILRSEGQTVKGYMVVKCAADVGIHVNMTV